jgi:WD40 repeat protein
MILLLILATGLGWLALRQSDEATKSRLRAQATRLASQALLAIPSDPAKSVAVALRSLRTRQTPQGERALREALPNSHLLAIMNPGDLAQTLVSFAQDGRVLVTAGVDGIARVWDSDTGELLRALRGHSKRINAMDVDASGQHVLTASSDGTARIWAISGGPAIVLQHDEPVVDAAFDPRRSWLATATLTGGVQIWDWSQQTPTLVADLSALSRNTAVDGSDFVTSVTFSSDGSLLVAGTWLGYVIGYELNGRVPALAFATDVQVPYVSTVAIDPQGDTIAAGNSNGTVSILDAQTGAPSEFFCCLGDFGINSLTFSSDGNLVLAAGGKIAETFVIGSGSYGAIMIGHSDWVYDASFSPDGRYVVTASSDGTARVWAAQTGRRLITLNGHTDGVLSARFSPDGDTVATVGMDGTARLWDVQAGIGFFRHGDMVMDVAWSPDGSTVVTADSDGRAFVWDPATGRDLFALDPSTDDATGDVFNATGVDVNPSGTRALVFGYRNTYFGVVHIFDLSTGDHVDSIDVDSPVSDASYSPDGERIVIVADRVTIRDAEAEEGAHHVLERLKGLGGEIQDAEMSSAERVVIFRTDGPVSLWNSASQQQIAILPDVRRAAAFSRDGKYLVTDGPGPSAQLWDPKTGRLLRRFPADSSTITAAAISADDAWVVAGDADGNTYVWSIDGHHLATLRMHADYINAIEVSPSGRSILSGSDDLSAKVYGCRTCVSLEQLKGRAVSYLRDLAGRGAARYRREAYRPLPA